MTTSSAHDLWRQAGGGTSRYDRAEYHRLMLEHGLMIPLKPSEKAEPLPCGWPRLNNNGLLFKVGGRACELVAANPDWRDGQAAFNALFEVAPDVADGIRGSDVDPFHHDERVDAFWDFVASWRSSTESTEESTDA